MINAELECKLACKKNCPDFDWDGEEFDYVGSCYKSALKAYKSLDADGHSGCSWNITKNILIRMMNGQVLSPITDDDFKDSDGNYLPAWAKGKGVVSSCQCPRMSSLFRYETKDGEVFYEDINRYFCRDIHNPRYTYHTRAEFLEKMFPITMPYMPLDKKYEIFTEEFLVNKKHGDFDTRAFIYMITPQGEEVDLDIYQTEGEDGKWKNITKEEYDTLYKKRIDKR